MWGFNGNGGIQEGSMGNDELGVEGATRPGIRRRSDASNDSQIEASEAESKKPEPNPRTHNRNQSITNQPKRQK